MLSINAQWGYGPWYNSYFDRDYDDYGFYGPRFHYGYRPFGYNPYGYGFYGSQNPFRGAIHGALTGALLGALNG
ncbi:unnamed protein product [Strongylus vulgaris]|uniref:Uncharacterized protein n=1 Tax=Strongylus vulgaris TaxID=40348 RepID=A0A3P7JK22_STRVU|nr:unnamed protein product [Strongylus vulgaris]